MHDSHAAICRHVSRVALVRHTPLAHCQYAVLTVIESALFRDSLSAGVLKRLLEMMK
jgi:hypothetical protein